MSDNESEDHIKAGINPPIFYPAVILIGALVIVGVLAPEQSGQFFSAMQSWLTATFGWFYLICVTAFLIFSIALAMSRYGQIRLGPDHSEPDFSYPAWFSMLFSAGMGIGLMFYGVAEPILHYETPSTAGAESAAAARDSLRDTMFMWGLHGWGVYAVVGLCLAYFGFRHNLPLRISSALYPVLGKRIHGPIGNIVDIVAVFGTLFGVAVSLGYGSQQVNSGLHLLFGVPQGTFVQLILIAIITAMATTSVVLGLDAGIRRLSQLNIILAIALLVFVAVVGPTLDLFRAMVENLGYYLVSLPSVAMTNYFYTGGEQEQAFLVNWKLFYWAWWVSWSPFVGMFVARVSRGRTVREFVLGVLIVPTLATLVWFTVFGNTALHLVMQEGATQLVGQVSDNASTALFHFLDYFPLSNVSSILATILVITFFVTSSDSGSLVIDILTAKSGAEPPVWQRVFWAVLEGLVAAVLLLAGGMGALRSATLASALPFTAIILAMMYCIYRALRVEAIKQDTLRYPVGMANAASSTLDGSQWRRRLDALVSSPNEKQLERFFGETAKPAFEEVARQFEARGLSTQVRASDHQARLEVDHGAEIDFVYGLRTRKLASPAFAISGLPSDSKQKAAAAAGHYRAEVYLREGGQRYNVATYTRTQLIADVLDQYENHLHFLYLIRAQDS